jgi:YD repeat-containing protein
VIDAGSGHVTAYAYDRQGRLVGTATGRKGRVNAPVAPSGFTVVRAD